MNITHGDSDPTSGSPATSSPSLAAGGNPPLSAQYNHVEQYCSVVHGQRSREELPVNDHVPQVVLVLFMGAEPGSDSVMRARARDPDRLGAKAQALRAEVLPSEYIDVFTATKTDGGQEPGQIGRCEYLRLLPCRDQG